MGLSIKENKETPPVIYHYLTINGRTRKPSAITSPKYSEYRRQWEENPKKGVVSDFPLYLNVESTGNCVGMCTYCFRTSRRTEIGEMDMGLYKRVVDECAKNNLYALNPSFLGEPTTHPQLIEMVEYAKRKGILDVAFDTNGFFVDGHMAKRIIKSGLDRIIFSVDVVNEEDYNRIKRPFDFKKVSNNINGLIRLREEGGYEKPNVTVQMKEGLGESREEMMAFIDYWANRADAVRVSKLFYPDGHPGRKSETETFPCPQLWQRLVVSWDGNVYPCLGDNAGRMLLGNVQDKSIKEIWHGKEMAELRNQHRTNCACEIDICNHCDLNEVPERADLYGIKTRGGKNGK